MTKAIQIDYVKNLHPVFTKQKRIKIIVGGRGSTKSTAIADYVAACMANGQLWCCARENQNSIEESVHRTILDEVDRLNISGFTDTKTSIVHSSGGRAFYRGLARNITSLKSTLSGVDGLWIEEGEDISENTLRVLTASVRLNAKDTQRLIEGEDVKMPEIIITMNRGTRQGAVAQKWLIQAEKELSRCGYYEDDLVMVVQMNYTDMPKAWFEGSGLEDERKQDEERLSYSAYSHKWLGAYLDEIENSIIKQEWFNAAIMAHELPHLKEVFKPKGALIAAHDPSDTGNDSKGFALRHGSIVRMVDEKTTGEIDEGLDWATGLALKGDADWFIWDGDGMGAGLKRSVATNLDGKKIQYQMFRGSLSGTGQDNATKIYQQEFGGRQANPKTYAETFKNNRAQYYTMLADRFYNTYKCVKRGEYIDPELMISLDTNGISNIDALRAEVCRIPAVDNANGLIQIMNKKEMKSNKIESPNMADSLMMCMFVPPIKKQRKAIKYKNNPII